MNTAPTIPEWNNEGILPPINTADPTSRDRSPYTCALLDFIERFGTSLERLEILEGFLEYRAFLHSLGIIEGFHWINGSFVEDKEQLYGNAPNDIDVITYFNPPASLTKSSLTPEQHGWMFKPEQTKERFKVDGSIMPFGSPSTEDFIEDNLYWSGLFSHTRTGKWKGFVKITLKPEQDAIAANHLVKLKQEFMP